MKGEDGDEWINEGVHTMYISYKFKYCKIQDNEVTTAGIDLLIFLAASSITAVIITMLMIFLL